VAEKVAEKNAGGDDEGVDPREWSVVLHRVLIKGYRGIVSRTSNCSEEKIRPRGGGKRKKVGTCSRVFRERESGGAGAVADIFWRFEDLWQSPLGDVSHAVKFPVGRRCDLARFQCSARGWAAEVTLLLPVQTVLDSARGPAGGESNGSWFMGHR
jgi:hypothetical protein